MACSALTGRAYEEILAGELIPAMGCTEPIAIAYAGALARETLGALPQRLELIVSSNIIKNAKSAVVPHTGGLKGLRAAVSAGVVAGRAEKQLEALAQVDDAQRAAIRDFLEQCVIEVAPAEGEEVFEILLSVSQGGDTARVHMVGGHTNVVLREKNGTVLYSAPAEGTPEKSAAYARLNVSDIYNYATEAPLEPTWELLERQIVYNSAIRDEGLTGNWGAGIGATLRRRDDHVKTRAGAAASAGSDARMSGCELPVVINSGSGNQGLTASLPVIEYAQELGVSRETLHRALLLSNLLTIHLKTGIGCLSAYCGAVSAGCAAGAAIAWLHGGDLSAVAHTLVNSLAILSGMVCDGAKPSCAAKIACAVDAGILGWQMYKDGRQFYGGDGIVTKGVENTIANVSRIGREGMRETDHEIIQIMLRDSV
ncbi:MAG: serine dehydratase subunit alpha family protein [Provencibacterium sp.]|jgi:L-cysteine desulfidase|nr:serine dehydratase subunit alpha family protein [Provencibacterium sp.]